MRRKFADFCILILLLSFIVPQLCHAITISATQTVEVGQPVSIMVQATPIIEEFSGCSIRLDFGDGSQAYGPTCTDTDAECGFATSHTYQRPGTYTLRASGDDCFAGTFANDPATRTITVVDLNIQRIDLKFGNGQPKITVKQYQRDLKAFAEIRYTGSGLLKGQWEIDGRLFSKVSKQLYRSRQKITIQTPVAPPLPTHAVDSHRLRFVITRPVWDLETPQALYFVTADPEQFKPVILLAAPKDNQLIVCEPTAFRWVGVPKAYVYLIEFVEAYGNDPIFSAYAKKSEYIFREDVCKSMFLAGRSYGWKVKALNQEGHIIGQSGEFNLFLKQ